MSANITPLARFIRTARRIICAHPHHVALDKPNGEHVIVCIRCGREWP